MTSVLAIIIMDTKNKEYWLYKWIIIIRPDQIIYCWWSSSHNPPFLPKIALIIMIYYLGFFGGGGSSGISIPSTIMYGAGGKFNINPIENPGLIILKV